MMKVEDVVVYAQNPATKSLMTGSLRRAMVEYNEDGNVNAVYTATPGLSYPKDVRGDGVVVTRQPVLYTVSEDKALGVAVSMLNSASSQQRMSVKEFYEKYSGLPFTM